MSEPNLRKEAIKRVKAKKNAKQLTGIFVIIWAIFIAVWALSTKDSVHGLTWSNFWPIWPIFGMSIALAFVWWGAYGPRDQISDSDIDAEMRKMQGGH